MSTRMAAQPTHENVSRPALFGAALTRTFYLFIPGVLFATIGYGALMLASPLLTRRKSTKNL